MSVLGIEKVDPAITLVLLIIGFWSTLMVVFVFTKNVLLPLGASEQDPFVSFIIHLAKSLAFLGIVGWLFYVWFKITKLARDAYLNNDS